MAIISTIKTTVFDLLQTFDILLGNAEVHPWSTTTRSPRCSKGPRDLPSIDTQVTICNNRTVLCWLWTSDKRRPKSELGSAHGSCRVLWSTGSTGASSFFDRSSRGRNLLISIKANYRQSYGNICGWWAAVSTDLGRTDQSLRSKHCF